MSTLLWVAIIAFLTNLRMQQLTRALDLTETQAEALRPVVGHKMRALAEMRTRRTGDASLRHRERRRDFRTLRRLQRKTDRTIEAELTPAQVDAYRAFRAEQRDRWRE